jgi:hypothetical protein
VFGWAFLNGTGLTVQFLTDVSLPLRDLEVILTGKSGLGGLE